MGPPRHNAGGSSRIHYSFGFFELGPDDALIVDASPPDARFWDVQLYNMGWFETLDFANRVTSLNHTQGHLSPDGRFRAVVAHRDPGVPNWLDTQGYEQGMITFRWISARTDPTPVRDGGAAADGRRPPPGRYAHGRTPTPGARRSAAGRPTSPGATGPDRRHSDRRRG